MTKKEILKSIKGIWEKATHPNVWLTLIAGHHGVILPVLAIAGCSVLKLLAMYGIGFASTWLIISFLIVALTFFFTNPDTRDLFLGEVGKNALRRENTVHVYLRSIFFALALGLLTAAMALGIYMWAYGVGIDTNILIVLGALAGVFCLGGFAMLAKHYYDIRRKDSVKYDPLSQSDKDKLEKDIECKARLYNLTFKWMTWAFGTGVLVLGSLQVAAFFHPIAISLAVLSAILGTFAPAAFIIREIVTVARDKMLMNYLSNTFSAYYVLDENGEIAGIKNTVSMDLLIQIVHQYRMAKNNYKGGIGIIVAASSVLVASLVAMFIAPIYLTIMIIAAIAIIVAINYFSQSKLYDISEQQKTEMLEKFIKDLESAKLSKKFKLKHTTKKVFSNDSQQEQVTYLTDTEDLNQQNNQTIDKNQLQEMFMQKKNDLKLKITNKKLPGKVPLTDVQIIDVEEKVLLTSGQENNVQKVQLQITMQDESHQSKSTKKLIVNDRAKQQKQNTVLTLQEIAKCLVISRNSKKQEVTRVMKFTEFAKPLLKI